MTRDVGNTLLNYNHILRPLFDFDNVNEYPKHKT